MINTQYPLHAHTNTNSYCVPKYCFELVFKDLRCTNKCKCMISNTYLHIESVELYEPACTSIKKEITLVCFFFKIPLSLKQFLNM